MKWYLWLAIGLVVLVGIYFIFVKKKTVTTTNGQLANNNTNSSNFNPYELIKIS